MEPINLYDWVYEHIPEDNMMWKSAFIQQLHFVQYELLQKSIIRLGYNRYQKALLNIQIVNTHVSKSITLPVYRIVTDNMIIIMRNNFHDWKVSVNSETPVLDLDQSKVFDPKERVHRAYCEGFKSEWVYPPYHTDPKKFTVEIRNDEDLVTFFKWLFT